MNYFLSRLIALTLLVSLVHFPSAAGAAPVGNTKLGKGALSGNSGNANTAVGSRAIDPNAVCTGAGAPNSCCTGVGKGKCGNDGAANTGIGESALSSNTTGNGNTAVGESSLRFNTTGGANTAVGDVALEANTTGGANTAVGWLALLSNTTGSGNSAVGWAALTTNTTGGANTAVGNGALSDNTSGNDNIAVGRSALSSNTTGSDNIGIGLASGSNLMTGNNNIYIGSASPADESNTIRIGDPGTQTAAFVAGINGATSSGGVAVFVNSSGQLGTITSSARFKDDIHDMRDITSGLMKLRPVRFRYKKEIDPSGLEQYGLVAEEVAKVYPNLVVYDDKGRPQTVRYHFVNAMLLNEVQKQARQLEAQRREVVNQQRQIETLTAQARQASAQAQQVEALTARLMQVETALGAQGHAPAVEASYKTRPGL